jgi:hypothetical protein
MGPSLRIALLAAVCVITAGAQEPTLPELLRRVHIYVTDYEDHVLSGMVAQETYHQQVFDGDGSVKQERRLVSEYVILQLPPDEAWYGFRNVIEVDGTPQPERVHRLEEIFASSESDPVEHAMQLADESAQFNVGGVYRTVNLPTFVLSFLRPANRKRLTFEPGGREDIEGTPTWIVSYREQKDSSFIATPNGKGLKASGRFWAEPSSGRVMRTELVVGPDRGTPWKGQIVVSYKYMTQNDSWLPAEMREVYENPRKASAGKITGVATYADYRRMDVRRRTK